MHIETIMLREGRTDVTLTTYVLDDSAEMLAGKKRPAVLICPGGGYLCCSDREAEPVALSFASMGYHTFVLRYSVYYSAEEALVYDRELEPRLGISHPAPVQDMGLAMKYIYEHADEWLLDESKIAICGFSAGCHNCAMYSVYWNKPLVTDFLGVKEGFRPAAAILGYGVFDNLTMKETIPAIKYPDLLEAYTVALFGEKEPSDVKRMETSPALLIDDAFPPSFIWATWNDDTVPVLQTAHMGKLLIEKNIPVEMHIFERGGHALALATQATSSALSNIMPDIAVWNDMVDRWLQKRFLLPLPELTMWEEMEQE